MLAQMNHFLDCIEKDLEPRTDPISSIEGLRVIWKLYEAEEKNTVANLKGEGFGSLEAKR
jgi:hypothetical protein